MYSFTVNSILNQSGLKCFAYWDKNKLFSSAWAILSSGRHELRKCRRKNFRWNFRNFTWPYLTELTSSEWLIKNDLLIWHDQLIWSGWFVDQLIWLISSWFDQLIKIFLFSKKNLEKKDLISWNDLADFLISWSKLKFCFWKKFLKEKHLNQLIFSIFFFIKNSWFFNDLIN